MHQVVAGRAVKMVNVRWVAVVLVSVLMVIEECVESSWMVDEESVMKRNVEDYKEEMEDDVKMKELLCMMSSFLVVLFLLKRMRYYVRTVKPSDDKDGVTSEKTGRDCLKDSS